MRQLKGRYPQVPTKSGLVVGIGETKSERRWRESREPAPSGRTLSGDLPS